MDLCPLAVIARLSAIVAGVLGVTGVASAAATAAKGRPDTFLAIAVAVCPLVVLGVSLGRSPCEDRLRTPRRCPSRGYAS